MLEGEDIKPWDPEPFILRRPGVEARMADEVARMGHLLQLLYRSEKVESTLGDKYASKRRLLTHPCSPTP